MADRPRRGRLLVVGAGITGISTAIEAAEAGCEVLLVERESFVGGRVAQMYQYFPKLCPPLCGLELNLRRLRGHPRIDCWTLTEVVEVTGAPGHFRVLLRRRARFVTDDCTACGACVAVCPAERASTFDFGMLTTRAVYRAHGAAWPQAYLVDPLACLRPDCTQCASVCPYQAVDLAAEDEDVEVVVQSIVWATGWEPYDARRLEELGFGTHPDIITNMMMERMASPQGPTGGRILRADGTPPRSVTFVQCAGSRDDEHLPYCSGVCCLASIKQTRYVRSQLPECEIQVYYIDLRAFGRYEAFLAAARQDERLRLVRGKVARVTAEAGRLVLDVEDRERGRKLRAETDLVVLATGMVPSVPLAGDTMPVASDRGFSPREIAPGQFSAGCARQPMEVAACVRDATSAALKALAVCATPNRRDPSLGGAPLRGCGD